MASPNNNKKKGDIIEKIIIGIIIAAIAFAVFSCDGSSKWSDLSKEEQDNARWAYYAQQAAEEYKK